MKRKKVRKSTDATEQQYNGESNVTLVALLFCKVCGIWIVKHFLFIGQIITPAHVAAH